MEKQTLKPQVRGKILLGERIVFCIKTNTKYNWSWIEFTVTDVTNDEIRLSKTGFAHRHISRELFHKQREWLLNFQK